MRKIGALLILLILNISLAYAISDVAYVLKNPNNPDNKFLDSFEELNLTVDLINIRNVNNVNLSKYRLVFVGNQRFSDPNLIKPHIYNSLIANSFHVNEFGLTSDGISQLASNAPLEVLKNDQLIQVYDRCCFAEGNSIGIPYYFLLYLNKNQHMKSIASTPLNEDDAVIGFINKTKELSNGNLTKGKVVFFGITETRYWTNEAKRLFKLSVKLALGPEDKDNDGFGTDDDCNDNDPLINPNADDIPYDGIDQDCSGEDLTDKDNDGSSFPADCDDNNPNINPNAVDVPGNNIDENCDGKDSILQPITASDTQVELLLFRNRDNSLINRTFFDIPKNTKFDSFEDFSLNYKLQDNLEKGFYDILLLGKADNSQCSLNDQASIRFTIFVEGENE